MAKKKENWITQWGWALLSALIIISILGHYYFMREEAKYDYDCIGREYCQDLGLDFTGFSYKTITCSQSIAGMTRIGFNFVIENNTAIEERYSEKCIISSQQNINITDVF